MSRLAGVAVVIGGLIAGEQYLVSNVPAFEFLKETASLPIPRLYGLVLLVNIIGMSFLMTGLSFKVGSARKAAITKAKKNGDQFAEARFSYPKMYAEGFSVEARVFNCIQRGHQHALETLPIFFALSLIGGVTCPLATVLGGILAIVSRLKWASGYATGEPENRYKHSRMGYHIWSSLFIQLCTATYTILRIMQIV